MPEPVSAQPSRLPSVDSVLSTADGRIAAARFGHRCTVEAVRSLLATYREATTAMAGIAASVVAARTLEGLLAHETAGLRPVFNLSGTVLHTNLGRAVLPEAAIEAVTLAMRGAVTLEFDVVTGKRGERDDPIRSLIRELTGAEDCVVVNNNAAAVLLALSSLSSGKETIVSRGELVEIGGSFRIPDIMRRAGARLREVGTTNRTHAADYEEAITTRTAAIMKVHASNYRIEGFVAQVPGKTLAAIAERHGLPIIDDLGSGTLIDLADYGLARERTVQDALNDGADLVTFSGDKLLGGPQVGIIAGRRDLIRRCAKNPLKRALRADKLRLAALEATLKLYRQPETLAQHLPTLRYFTKPKAELSALARQLLPALQAAVGEDWRAEDVSLMSQIGSGALPRETLPSAGIALSPVGKKGGRAVDQLAARFRELPQPVIGRVNGGRLLFDLRCLDDVDGFKAQLSRLGRTS